MEIAPQHAKKPILLILIASILLSFSGCSGTVITVSPEPDGPNDLEAKTAKDPDFSHMDLIAEADTLGESVGDGLSEEPSAGELRTRPGNDFSLIDCSYDGSSLSLTYRPEDMLYPVEFGFRPVGIDLYDMGHWYINTGWQDHMAAEEYAYIEKMFREKEEYGFALRYMYLGDHIRLTDGTDLGPWSSQPGNSMGSNTILLSSLPAEALNRDALEIELTIREVIEYHYKDGEKYYYGSEPLEEKTVTITVPCQRS